MTIPMSDDDLVKCCKWLFVHSRTQADDSGDVLPRQKLDTALTEGVAIVQQLLAERARLEALAAAEREYRLAVEYAGGRTQCCGASDCVVCPDMLTSVSAAKDRLLAAGGRP